MNFVEQRSPNAGTQQCFGDVIFMPRNDTDSGTCFSTSMQKRGEVIDSSIVDDQRFVEVDENMPKLERVM